MNRPILTRPSLVHEIASRREERPGHWVTSCSCSESWSGPNAHRSLSQHVAEYRKRLQQFRIDYLTYRKDEPCP